VLRWGSEIRPRAVGFLLRPIRRVVSAFERRSRSARPGLARFQAGASLAGFHPLRAQIRRNPLRNDRRSLNYRD
jgi:hypothetical protein